MLSNRKAKHRRLRLIDQLMPDHEHYIIGPNTRRLAVDEIEVFRIIYLKAYIIEALINEQNLWTLIQLLRQVHILFKIPNLK